MWLTKLKEPMEMMWLSHIISVMLSDRPVGAGVCSIPVILDQPDEVAVAVLVEELRP